jgi:hypothetical protein
MMAGERAYHDENGGAHAADHMPCRFFFFGNDVF